MEPQKEEVSEVDHLELHYAVQPQKTKANAVGTNLQTSNDQVKSDHQIPTSDSSLQPPMIQLDRFLATTAAVISFFITESPTVKGPVGDMKDGHHMLSGEGGTASSPRFSQNDGWRGQTFSEVLKKEEVGQVKIVEVQ
ncbi:hypothetical protein ACFX12_034899 [Malus domestica]